MRERRREKTRTQFRFSIETCAENYFPIFHCLCREFEKPIIRSSTWAYAGRSLVAIDSTSNWNRHAWRPTTCLRTQTHTQTHTLDIHSTLLHGAQCTPFIAPSLTRSDKICMRLAVCVPRSTNISEFSAVGRGRAKRIRIELHGSRFVNTILLFSARRCLCSSSMFYFCQSLKCCFNYDNTVNVWLMHNRLLSVWSWIAVCDVFTWCNFRSLLAFFR